MMLMMAMMMVMITTMMMPRMWVATTTQWYKSHGCRRYKSYWERILRQLSLQNWKQGGWVQSKYSQFRLCYCSVSKKSLLESLVFVVFQCCLLYLYWLFIQIISAFVFVFGSKTLFSSPIMQKAWKISRAHFFTKKIAQQTREPVNMRICKKKKRQRNFIRQGISSQYKNSYLDLAVWYRICQLNQNIINK